MHAIYFVFEVYSILQKYVNRQGKLHESITIITKVYFYEHICTFMLWADITVSEPQIYKGDPRTCIIFIPAWGLNWGSLDFSCNQNNCGSSGAYITCICCSLNMKINMRKMLHRTPRSWTHLSYLFTCVAFLAEKHFGVFI